LHSSGSPTHLCPLGSFALMGLLST
jgi:hypothetical protein